MAGVGVENHYLFAISTEIAVLTVESVSSEAGQVLEGVGVPQMHGAVARFIEDPIAVRAEV